MKIEKGPFAGKEIILAPQTQLSQFTEEQVQELLELIGYPEALITDQSSLSDFGLDPEEVQAITAHYGFAVERTDYLVDVLVRAHRRHS